MYPETDTLPAPPTPARPPMRTFTKVIIGFNALMLALVVLGLFSAVTGSASRCAAEVGNAYISTAEAQDACATGSAIGIAVGVVGYLVVTALGDAILGVLWLVTRRDR